MTKTFKRPAKEAGGYDLSGRLDVTETTFTLTLTGTKPGTQPPDPPELPERAEIIEPTGGDDTALLRDKVNRMADGDTLVLRGMFRVSDTLKFEGGRGRTVCGYPGERSGLLVESAEMPGMYGAMLWFKDAQASTMRDLEIDGQNKSTTPVEVDWGSGNTIERLYIHDIGYSGSDDGTLAAIHSEGGAGLTVRGCRIERTGGNPDRDEGIRGIWLGKGQADALVEDNDISDTGHTCIAVEPCSAIIRRNRASNSLTQGTLFKIMLHPQSAYTGKVEFYENTGEHSKNGGLMLEAAAYELVDIHHNTFRDCGAQGTTFGFLYTSQSTTRNARVHDNIVENCRSFGAMNRSENCEFDNNRITGENTLWLESDVHNVTVNNSGQVSVGSGCTNIWVDGQQIA